MNEISEQAVALARHTAKVQAGLAGEWAGVADALARTLRQHADPDDIDVAAALSVYENVNARFPRPIGLGARNNQ